MFNTDNLEDAPTFKFCQQHHKRVLNPIVDWSDADVWEFIKEYKVPYCSLYDEGFKRLGCIGCPMADNEKELSDYPKFKNLYLIAFQKMLDERRKQGLKTMWTSPEEVMEWWFQKGTQTLPDTEITELLE